MCIRESIVAVVCAILLSSCSVKSDRAQCPSLLFLSVLGGEDEEVFVNIAGEDYESLMHIEKTNGVAVAGVDLKKGRFRISAHSGSILMSSGIIALGEEMPQLYAYAENIECTSDVTEVVARLDKQFCRLKVKVTGIECDAQLRGNVCGMDLWDLSPISGHFYVRKEPLMSGQESRLFEFVIPRQKDSSLMLELISEGRLISSFEIGKDLIAAGMDWNKASLEDMEVSIQSCESGFVISVKNWVQVEI